jgi:TonB-dependent receptor
MRRHNFTAWSAKLFLTSVKASLLLLLPCMAMAQSQVTEDEGEFEDVLEEVVVTGYRQSLSSARDIKRESKGIVDAVVAEDIGKLPDQNIAEALQRIPGLSITRDNGEGSQVSVRGVAPNLNRISVNGKTLTSDGDDQAVGFEAFSAGLLDRIDVIKSPSANMVEGSLGGSVMLKTKKPLDLKQRKIVVTAQAQYNDLSKETDPKGAFNYFDQYRDGTVGLGMSLTYEKRSLRQDGFEVFGYDMPVSLTGASNRKINTKAKDDDGNSLYDPETGTLLCTDLECHPDRFLPDGTDLGPYGAHAMRAPNHRLFLDERERLGASFTLDFMPSDTTRLVFDFTYSTYEVTRERYQFSTGFQNKRIEPDSVVIGDNNTIVSMDAIALKKGKLDGGKLPGMQSNNVWQWQNTDSAIYGALFEKKFERLNMQAMVGYTDTTRRTPENYRFSFNNAGYTFPMSYDLTQSPVPVWGVMENIPEDVELPGDDFMDPSFFGLQAVTALTDKTDDTELAGSLDFDMDINGGPFSRLYFGIRATDREKDRIADAPRFTKNADSPGDFTITMATDGVMAPFPANNWASEVPGDLIRSWMIADLKGTMEAFGMDGDDLYGSGLSDPDPLKSYVITEKTNAAYLMTDYEFANGRLIGDLGVRVVNTKSTSSGFFDDGSGVQARDFEVDYTETLPSLNARFAIKEDLFLRFAAARVMARPTFGEVAPRLTISMVNGRISGGNPLLRPLISDQLDLYLAYYWDGGMVAAGVFYKDIKDFIQKYTRITTFPDFEAGDGSCVIGGEGNDVDENGCLLFDVTQPMNGPNAKVKGFELNVNADFTFLPGILANTGIAANYTYNDSEATLLDPDTGETVPADFNLQGLSEHSYNVTLYYEDRKFDARLAYNYRSDYLMQAYGGQSNTNYHHDYDQLDFQAGYSINDRVKLTFQAVNLTNSWKWGYQGWYPYWPQEGGKDRAKFLNYDGTSYRLGVVFNF